MMTLSLRTFALRTFVLRAFAGLLLACGLGLSSVPASAETAHAGGITIEDPWSRATPRGVQIGVGYLSVVNAGVVDTLLSASCDCSSSVEFHVMKQDGGVMQMLHMADGLEIPAHATFTLQPGGAHLMLIGLNAPLKSGDVIKVKLMFKRAGAVVIDFEVAPLRGRRK